jgi:hypothetical protein
MTARDRSEASLAPQSDDLDRELKEGLGPPHVVRLSQPLSTRRRTVRRPSQRAAHGAPFRLWPLLVACLRLF